MKHQDALLHVKGSSLFIDDFKLPGNLLHAAVLVSPVSYGEIKKLETGEALSIQGVEAIITAEDIPGKNQIGNIIMDEPLLAENEVHFIGEPVAVVLADTPAKARQAVKAIGLEIEKLPSFVDPRVAFQRGMLIAPPRTFSMGNISDAWDKCHFIVQERADSGGQEHLYLETQGAFAVPMENGCIRITSGTQGPTFVQKIAARVLNVPMHRIEVEVGRLGGAFGGKEDQATPWAVMAALGVLLTGKPVKLVLNRNEDMTWTGKRHPYSSDFRLGLKKDGTMLAWEVTYYQNGGAASDLSTAILERTLFHSTNAYFIPNVKATGICCRTNLPPNTAFRGFGAPQAMYVLESAIYCASRVMGISPHEIQEKNLLKRGDRFPFGMEYEGNEIRRSWKKAHEMYQTGNTGERIKEFNTSNVMLKKGISFMPVCFGISFTNTSLNQANALVHVYTDGSVGISTGAVEMGQGVNTKIAQVAARTFGIDLSRIKVETTNTTRAANTSPTAASSAADMNGNAVIIACGNILKRLLAHARKHLGKPDDCKTEMADDSVLINGKMTDLGWEQLVNLAYLARISLSSQAHYATPGLHFDKSSEKGRPFAYHVSGTAVTEITLDCLRGTFSVDSVRIVHDTGDSINPLVDRGQVEGGLLQGIGWVTLEELKYHPETDTLLSDSLATYKIPDIYFTPGKVDVEFLECLSENAGVYNSKAVGEPPFMYGIGTYFAILEAIKACDPEILPVYSAPLTNEKILLLLNKKR
ncbi:MAG: molybdopterin-dependent oxidoreductase [Candidatus Aegiribacteria sp.]|nr:molybdopterin-dependent oxidoreductase [Candidatus Aegiribacteria sp.]